MKAKILSLLREHEESISGQQLCEHFGVSRTAIWKVMKQLKAEGYEIESISNKGYRLMETPDILSESEIKSQLNTQWIGKECRYFKEVDSTNLQAKLYAEQGGPQGTIFVADAQTQGRGRRGRIWESPSGGNLYFTILLRPDFQTQQAPMITLLMALAVVRGLEQTCDITAQIKWPNDIILSEKKVCGILTEMSAEMDGIHYIVVGTGINISEVEYSDEVAKMCTSVKSKSKKKIVRSHILQCIVKEFENLYDTFVTIKDLSFIKNEYESHLINLNHEIKVLEVENEYRAVAKGITKQGELIVEDQEGKEHLVYAGEVSVRGLYGYV